MQAGPKHPRQAHQRNVEVIRRSQSLFYDLIDAGEARSQFGKLRLRIKQHHCAELLEQRGIAQELDRIADALLGAKQDRAPPKILAGPYGARGARTSQQSASAQTAILVLLPPFRELSAR